MALVDVLSHGRLEAGFVRGVPYEILPANSNPMRMNERHWEALDLIVKAWTSHDGPFSHEGRFFHYRAVNIWPRPWQQPHPPVWISTTSPEGAARVGARGFVQATFLTGYNGTAAIFDGYRQGWRTVARGAEIPIDRLAYAAFIYTAPTEAAAHAKAEKLLWHIAINKIPAHFANPPGYLPAAVNAQILAGQRRAPGFPKLPSVANAIEQGIMFAGTPDQVYGQIARFYAHVGGFGHLLMLGQSGFLDHDDTVRGIRLLAREVYPRLKQAFPDAAPSGVAATTGAAI
jgi:alkanesulfonate monooxygenase SsuD/methylene tetrahydromethanopterin reductase-like flavin-dependent oxidoreductase (luciferase family)